MTTLIQIMTGANLIVFWFIQLLVVFTLLIKILKGG